MFLVGADLLARFKDRLTTLSAELQSVAKRPGDALVKSSRLFVEMVQRHVEGKGSLKDNQARHASTKGSLLFVLCCCGVNFEMKFLLLFCLQSCPCTCGCL